MIAVYIQDCSSPSPLLDYYATREYEWKSAGAEIKDAITKLNFVAWFPFNKANLNTKRYFTVQRMRYEDELYAVVTNSAINYIFKIHGATSKNI